MYQPDYAMDGAPTIVFDGTLEECREWIESAENETYYTSNGEAGAPEYIIIPSISFLSVGDGVGHEDGSMYDWDDVVCEQEEEDNYSGYPCGECRACMEHMMEQDIERIRKMEVVEDCP
jgi:hypothetical protein